MQHLRSVNAAFLPDGLLNQLAGVNSAFVFMHFPAHDLAAVQIHDQVRKQNRPRTAAGSQVISQHQTVLGAVAQWVTGGLLAEGLRARLR